MNKKEEINRETIFESLRESREKIIGCHNIEELSQNMRLFTLNVTGLVDKCLETRKMDYLYELQEILHTFIIHMHFKHTIDKFEEEKYKDFMSALLSCYIDIKMTLEKSSHEAKTGIFSELLMWLQLIFGACNTKIIDVFLQLQTPWSTSWIFLKPILTQMFESLSSITTISPEFYIKLLILVKMFKTKNTDAKNFERRLSELKCPEDLISWLKSKGVKRFTKKFQKSRDLFDAQQLSKIFTLEDCEEVLDCLNEYRVDDSSRKTELEPQEEEGLFVYDRKGNFSEANIDDLDLVSDVEDSYAGLSATINALDSVKDVKDVPKSDENDEDEAEDVDSNDEVENTQNDVELDEENKQKKQKVIVANLDYDDESDGIITEDDEIDESQDYAEEYDDGEMEKSSNPEIIKLEESDSDYDGEDEGKDSEMETEDEDEDCREMFEDEPKLILNLTDEDEAQEESTKKIKLNKPLENQPQVSSSSDNVKVSLIDDDTDERISENSPINKVSEVPTHSKSGESTEEYQDSEEENEIDNHSSNSPSKLTKISKPSLDILILQSDSSSSDSISPIMGKRRTKSSSSQKRSSANYTSTPFFSSKRQNVKSLKFREHNSFSVDDLEISKSVSYGNSSHSRIGDEASLLLELSPNSSEDSPILKKNKSKSVNSPEIGNEKRKLSSRNQGDQNETSRTLQPESTAINSTSPSKRQKTNNVSSSSVRESKEEESPLQTPQRRLRSLVLSSSSQSPSPVKLPVNNLDLMKSGEKIRSPTKSSPSKTNNLNKSGETLNSINEEQMEEITILDEGITKEINSDMNLVNSSPNLNIIDNVEESSPIITSRNSVLKKNPLSSSVNKRSLSPIIMQSSSPVSNGKFSPIKTRSQKKTTNLFQRRENYKKVKSISCKSPEKAIDSIGKMLLNVESSINEKEIVNGSAKRLGSPPINRIGDKIVIATPGKISQNATPRKVDNETSEVGKIETKLLSPVVVLTPQKLIPISKDSWNFSSSGSTKDTDVTSDEDKINSASSTSNSQLPNKRKYTKRTNLTVPVRRSSRLNRRDDKEEGGKNNWNVKVEENSEGFTPLNPRTRVNTRRKQQEMKSDSVRRSYDLRRKK